MRLICPNCDAHYEVESRLIPENGRDVQCSSCGDTWFQAPPTEEDHLNPDLDADIFAKEDDPDNTLQGAPDEAPEVEAAPAVDLTADISSAFDPDQTLLSAAAAAQSADDGYDEDEAEDAAEPAAGAPERTTLDSNLMKVLREEAERETQARVEEGSADVPTDAPLDAPVTSETVTTPKSVEESGEVEEAVRERTARLRGIEPEDLSDGSPSSRRDLLPDIEEINSTLRATSDRKTDEANGAVASEDDPKKRSGFRTGFSLIIVLVAVLLLVYTFAPQIGAKVPALDPVLKSYVRTADAGRVKLDAFMETLIAKMGSEDTAPTE